MDTVAEPRERQCPCTSRCRFTVTGAVGATVPHNAREPPGSVRSAAVTVCRTCTIWVRLDDFVPVAEPANVQR